MQRAVSMSIGKEPVLLRILAAVVLSIAVLLSATAPAYAARDKEEQAKGRVLSTRVGEPLSKALEALQEEPPNNQKAMDILNRVMAMKNLTPYESAVLYQMHGQANYGLKNISGTISDWENAIATGALAPSDVDGLLPNIGQLYLAQGQMTKGINTLENWIRGGGVPSAGINMMLAQALAQTEQFRRALPYAEQAFNMTNPPKKQNFDLLNYLYNSLKMYGKQASLLEKQASIWPDDKNVWRGMASLKQQAGRPKEAFEINKIMYLNGMLNTEQELTALCQYYSFYEVPYRGAQILEREMNGGRVSKSAKNLKLLSDMWRQARVYDKAIPVLQQAADAAPNGILYEQLGEAYMAEHQYAKAEAAFRKALAKGGLRKTGNTYLLIANSIYERDMPRKALKEYEKAMNYPESRKRAKGWIKFIKNGFEVARKKKEFAAQVKLDECKNQLDRKKRLGDTNIEGLKIISGECEGILKSHGLLKKAGITAENRSTEAKTEG